MPCFVLLPAGCLFVVRLWCAVVLYRRGCATHLRESRLYLSVLPVLATANKGDRLMQLSRRMYLPVLPVFALQLTGAIGGCSLVWHSKFDIYSRLSIFPTTERPANTCYKSIYLTNLTLQTLLLLEFSLLSAIG